MIDLDELAAQARDHRSVQAEYMPVDVSSALALIARIRELEAGLGQAADSVASYYEDQRCSSDDLECEEAAGYRAIIAKGIP